MKFENNIENDLIKEAMFQNITPEIIIEAIKKQCSPNFSDDLELNQLLRLDEKISDELEDEQDNNELREAMTTLRHDVYSSVLTAIEEEFRFKLDLDNEYVSLYDTTKILYQFFIFDYRVYLKGFIAGYIYKNRKEFHKLFNEAKLNNRFIASKKLFKDPKDALIIGNIYDVVRNIMELDIEEDNFLKYITYVNGSNTAVLTEIIKLFKNGMIEYEKDELYSNFMAPFLNTARFNLGSIVSDVVEILMDVLPTNNIKNDIANVDVNNSNYDESESIADTLNDNTEE